MRALPLVPSPHWSSFQGFPPLLTEVSLLLKADYERLIFCICDHSLGSKIDRGVGSVLWELLGGEPCLASTLSSAPIEVNESRVRA
jgi:hypothetical protein